MLSEVFQPVLDQMRGITHKSMGVVNNTSVLVSYVGEPVGDDEAFSMISSVQGNGRPFICNGYSCVAIGTRNIMEFVVYVKGTDPEEQKLSALLAISISNLQIHCADRYDKISYLKSVLQGNVLPGDINLRSGELQIDADVSRVVFIVQIPGNETGVVQLMQNMFPEQDFIINIDNKNIVLIKSIAPGSGSDFAEKIAKSIVETINSELMLKVFVGIGTPVDTINDISRSYSEARLAIEIGRVFEGDKYILSYDELGIGRLIYQLPSKLCELFLDEIFKKDGLEVLDDETLQTIDKFFENNLNVSETSRQLFVHRNTLVYRLDKIERLTGLDLRKFDDAVVFKVAVLVSKYLTSNPSKF
ncbi:MAG: helix-turn-helix domain-containing protein [Clostridia bacterium]|nr:helix-turn-helix domain-containing protein [Clostridia bacterium]